MYRRREDEATGALEDAGVATVSSRSSIGAARGRKEEEEGGKNDDMETTTTTRGKLTNERRGHRRKEGRLRGRRPQSDEEKTSEW